MDQSKVRDIRQPGHFWADNEVVDDYLPAIGVYGFAVYMLLAKYADAKTGQCDPSVGGMATKLGLSDPTVRKALDKLEACGLIRVKHRRREKNGKLINQTSVYTLLAVEKHQRDIPTKGDLVPNEVDHPTKPDLPGVLNEVYQGTKGDLPGVLNHVSRNNTHKNKTQLTRGGEGQPDSPALTPAVQAYFDTYSTVSLKPDAVEAINSTVTDLARWRQVLKDWSLSDWKATNVRGMLDRYTSGRTAKDERPGGANGKHEPARPLISPAVSSIPADANSPTETARKAREALEARKR